MRHQIEKNRLKTPLFDTEKWVKHLELGLREAFRLYSHENRSKANIYVANHIKNESKNATMKPSFQGPDDSYIEKTPL